MKERIFKAVKHVPPKLIGKTLVIHAIRYRLKITSDQYALLDYLANHYKKNPDQRITYFNLFQNTGIVKKELREMWQSLKKKNLVRLDPVTKVVYPTKLWYEHFDSKKIEGFEDFWRAYGIIDGHFIGKRGNKALAEKNYATCVAISSPEILIEAAKAYTLNCHTSGTFIKNASTWLNPKYKYWEDELVDIKKEDTKNVVKPELNDFMNGAKK